MPGKPMWVTLKAPRNGRHPGTVAPPSLWAEDPNRSACPRPGNLGGLLLGFPSGPRRVMIPMFYRHALRPRAQSIGGREQQVRKDARLALSLRRSILPGYAGAIGGCQACLIPALHHPGYAGAIGGCQACLIPAPHHPTITRPNQPICLCNDPATLIVWACG